MLIGMQSDARHATRSLRRVRWAVRAALTLGIAASVAANVLHAQPDPIARVIAAWPPVALLITLELISRVPVHRRALAALRFAATGVIAGIAAWVSYWHMAAVAWRYGEEAGAAHLIPISVDGLVVVASVCLVELAGRIRAVGSPSPEPAPQRGNPTPVTASKPLVSLTKTGGQSDAPSQRGEDLADTPEARRLHGLARLLTGVWTVEQSAAHAGLSVRRFQLWADSAAAATRRPRGGPRKPPPEPTTTPVPDRAGELADATTGGATR